ncbi:MAG: hypothetical protein VXZ89_06325 [Candidatus Thermoplasmatota archaeon]|nr:hypothetical protein [Candidatus Thermoplasmatota archaeon]
MSWWPFSRKSSDTFVDDPHIKGSRMWLIELQEVCEKEYQNPASGQARVREMQIEWTDAHSKGEISDDLLQGLDRRAFRLLRATSEEWLQW